MLQYYYQFLSVISQYTYPTTLVMQAYTHNSSWCIWAAGLIPCAMIPIFFFYVHTYQFFFTHKQLNPDYCDYKYLYQLSLLYQRCVNIKSALSTVMINNKQWLISTSACESVQLTCSSQYPGPNIPNLSYDMLRAILQQRGIVKTPELSSKAYVKSYKKHVVSKVIKECVFVNMNQFTRPTCHKKNQLLLTLKDTD